MHKIIPTMPGPEDMVLDTTAGYPRILVSCCKRRWFEDNPIKGAPDGGLGYIDLRTDEFFIFKLKWDLRNTELQLEPHGIDLADIDGKTYLYVISHKNGGNPELVVKFLVQGDTLVYITEFPSELLISPNDIAVMPDGSFYCTNDSTKKNFLLKSIDQGFNLRSSNIVYYNDSTKNWHIAHSDLPFANGILFLHDKVYVTCVNATEIYVFSIVADHKLKLDSTIKGVKGMDNISVKSNGELIIPAHLNRTKFLLHIAKISSSPTNIYKVDVNTKKLTHIGDYSASINAGSTAIVYNDHLYISQVCESFVLKVKL